MGKKIVFWANYKKKTVIMKHILNIRNTITPMKVSQKS